MRNGTFNPSAQLYQNIKGAVPNINKGMMLPCVISKVYHTHRADIFIPHTCTVIDSVPIIFNSFSENQGDIAMPEKDSLAMYIRSSDGRHFVWGGISLSPAYIVRNVLPGESERYVENASFKQDLLGNQILSSYLTCHAEILKGDGEKQSYLKSEYKKIGEQEFFSDTLSFGEEKKFVSIKNIYRKPSSSQKNDIQKENKDVQKKVQDFLVRIQNLKEDYSEESLLELKDKIRSEFQDYKSPLYIIEEGAAFDSMVLNYQSFYNLSDIGYLKGEDGTPIIYRFRVFDCMGRLTYSYSITENGNKEEWENTSEIILEHNLNDYPQVDFYIEDAGEARIPVQNLNLVYLDKDKIRIDLRAKYGEVECVVRKDDFEYLIKTTAHKEINLSLGPSAKKLQSLLKQ